MAYLVQTKFRNEYKDFHLNECVYVENYKTLKPDPDGALGVGIPAFESMEPEFMSELESVGLVIRRTRLGYNVICMPQIKVYDLVEGEAPKNGTSYGWFNYQWLPLRQAKKEVEIFISTL